MTPDRFDGLMEQVADLAIDTEERLKAVVDLIYEKAIDELNFSLIYGKMCRRLSTLKVPTTGETGKTTSFRKLLLNRCQQEFEKDKVDSECQRLEEELDEARNKARRRSIGNVKFIGQLYKLKMLTEPIVVQCVEELLSVNDEESLEGLCGLLTAVGQKLEFQASKLQMDHIFGMIQEIMDERKTSNRIRFALQDLVDLRLNNWVPRRAAPGPKAIWQFRMEAELEDYEEQRKVLQCLELKRRTDPRSQRELDDQPEKPKMHNRGAIDVSKLLKLLKNPVDEIQLSPAASILRTKDCAGWDKAGDSDILLNPGVQREQSIQGDNETIQMDHQKTPDGQTATGDVQQQSSQSSQ